MLPWYSAGSNSVGESENGAAQVIWPSGAASTPAPASSGSDSVRRVHRTSPRRIAPFIVSTSHRHQDRLDLVHRRLHWVFAGDGVGEALCCCSETSITQDL